MNTVKLAERIVQDSITEGAPVLGPGWDQLARTLGSATRMIPNDEFEVGQAFKAILARLASVAQVVSSARAEEAWGRVQRLTGLVDDLRVAINRWEP